MVKINSLYLFAFKWDGVIDEFIAFNEFVYNNLDSFGSFGIIAMDSAIDLFNLVPIEFFATSFTSIGSFHLKIK